MYTFDASSGHHCLYAGPYAAQGRGLLWHQGRLEVHRRQVVAQPEVPGGKQGMVAATVVNTVIQPGPAVRLECHPPYQTIEPADADIVPRARSEPDDIVQLHRELPPGQ